MTHDDAPRSTISRRRLPLAGLVGASMLLAGCASQITALAQDPAIVGSTGFWFRVGLAPAPEAGMAPMPGVTFFYGTIWRIGGPRDVTVQVGSQAGQGDAALPSSRASLKIKAGPVATPAPGKEK